MPHIRKLSTTRAAIFWVQRLPLERWWFNAKPRPAVGITEIDYGFTAEYFNGADFSGRTGSDETRFADQLQLDLPCPDDKVDSRQFLRPLDGNDVQPEEL